MQSALPEHWIDALFARLTGLYGNRFTNMWTGIDAGLVRTTWATELAGIRPESIKYALEHLPAEFPPSALQFKALCLQKPSSDAPALTNSTPAAPSVRSAVLAGLKKSEGVAGDAKEWARRLKARHDAGDVLNANQIRCYKNALGLHPGGAQL